MSPITIIVVLPPLHHFRFFPIPRFLNYSQNVSVKFYA